MLCDALCGCLHGIYFVKVMKWLVDLKTVQTSFKNETLILIFIDKELWFCAGGLRFTSVSLLLLLLLCVGFFQPRSMAVLVELSQHSVPAHRLWLYTSHPHR